MDKVMTSSIELAAKWWRLFDDQAIIDALSPSALQKLYEVQDAVSRLCSDPNQLAGVLRDILATASTDADIPFIGTTVLEDAFHALGDRAFSILETSGIPVALQESIRSGCIH